MPRWPAILIAVSASWSASAENRALDHPPLVASKDGRLLNHFPYFAEPKRNLVRPPRGSHGPCTAIHRDMRPDLETLLERARAELPPSSSVTALSCFRSRAHQARIFSRFGRGESVRDQAYQIAPAGHSEHATGYAIDFGERSGRCRLVACFAATDAGRWLTRNAPDFGFEMSFPEGNRQGVAFEPWHWRWVGRDGSASTQRAQAVFAAARSLFPGGPSVDVAVRFAVLTELGFAPIVSRSVVSLSSNAMLAAQDSAMPPPMSATFSLPPKTEFSLPKENETRRP